MSTPQPLDQSRHARPAYRQALALAVVLAALALVAAWVLFGTRENVSERASTSSEPHATALVTHASPRELPDIAFQDGSGAVRHLSDFRGRTVLLNLWATWCVPCRTEMPTLDRLQSRLGSQDFEVVALSIDREGAGIVKRFFEETNVHALKVYVDPSMAAQQALNAVGVPMTVLIDRDGREVARKLGPAQWDSPEIVAMIRRYVPQTGR